MTHQAAPEAAVPQWKRMVTQWVMTHLVSHMAGAQIWRSVMIDLVSQVCAMGMLNDGQVSLPLKAKKMGSGCTLQTTQLDEGVVGQKQQPVNNCKGHRVQTQTCVTEHK